MKPEQMQRRASRLKDRLERIDFLLARHAEDESRVAELVEEQDRRTAELKHLETSLKALKQ